MGAISLDRKTQIKGFEAFGGVSQTSLGWYLVEAGGFEPPSVSSLPSGLHA